MLDLLPHFFGGKGGEGKFVKGENFTWRRK